MAFDPKLPLGLTNPLPVKLITTSIAFNLGAPVSSDNPLPVAVFGGLAPSFTAQPTVTPTSGTAGQTFTATPGTVANGSVTAREWRLAGTVVSMALSYVSTAAGALTYQEFAVASSLISVTVTAAVTLGALGLSSTAFSTGGTTSVGITGRTAGSTITATSSDGTTLSVTGTTLTGTFTAAGSPTISLTEILAGATNTPRVTTVVVTVSAAALPPFLGSSAQKWGDNTTLVFGKAA